MKLVRPLVIFDVEATGLNVERSRIIEFAAMRIEPSGDRMPYETLVDPEEPIPAEVREITGIKDADVAGAPTFREVADRIAALLENADLGGYNISNFDVPLLRAEFGRLQRALPVPHDVAIVDALEILRKYEIRSLDWAHRYYFGKPMAEAHRALADIEGTEAILFEQIRRYELAGGPREIVAKLRHPYLDSRRKLRRENGNVVVCFGKFSGKTLRAIHDEEASYLDWMVETLDPEIADIVRMERADFPPPKPRVQQSQLFDPTRR